MAKTLIVSVPVMSQDVSLADEPDIGRWMSLADWFVMQGEEPYHDGPVSRRVAVVDLDPRTGTLRPGAKFVDGRPAGETSRFAVEEGERDEWGDGEIARLESDSFLQASVFGTVVKTLQAFERAPMLARPLTWAFGSGQLLVVPRAGEMANAFYDRDTHSLQFFSVEGDEAAGPVHTALSHDVVTHETAHAVLDAICPDLYDAISPQARALHESFADLTSLLLSLTDTYRLRMELDIEGRSLRSQTTFARLAEQLGRHLGAAAGLDALRDANNRRTLDPADTSVDRHGTRNFVGGVTPHDLSLVMTGALYGVFRRLALDGRKRFAAAPIPKSYARLDLGPAALGAYLAAQRVAQMVVRALDHLPPGDASFADFGRAVLVADEFTHPKGLAAREWLIDELVARKAVESRRALTGQSVPAAPEFGGTTPEALLEGDAAARRFAERNRRLLGMPDGAPFEVQPRYVTVVRPASERVNAAQPRRGLVFRVSWEVAEENGAVAEVAPVRAVRSGTTLVLELPSGAIRSLLTSDTAAPRHASERDTLLRWLRDEGLLVRPDVANGPDGKRLRGPAIARTVRQRMRLEGGARMVHCSTLRWPSS